MRSRRWRFAWAWTVGAVLLAGAASAIRPIYVVAAGETKVIDARGEPAGAITVLTSEGVKASGTLTFATAAALDGETVVIGAKTYTFETGTLDQDGEVLPGATHTASRDNLLAAITLGAGAGTTYATQTTAHPTATAAAGAGDALVVTALVGGTAGNALASTETLTNGSWAGGATTLSGGTDVTATIRYSVDDSGADGPAAGVTTVTDTSGGKLQTVTEWPILEVTSSGGDTYVAVW